MADPVEPRPLDEERLMKTVGGDLELLAEIVRIFLEDQPQMSERLNDALRKGDPERVWRAAHAIKGSVGNFAAGPASSLAGELEEVAQKQDLAEARRLADSLAREVERLRDRLTGFLDS